LDAKSFAPLLREPNAYPADTWRHSVLLEHWESTNLLGRQMETTFVGLRTYDACYVEWANGDDEYYDEQSDPSQLDNRIASLPAAMREFFGGMMRVHRQSGAAPRATVVGRANSAPSLIAPQGAIIGFADDDSGIQRVRVIILDPSTGLYWNGSQWQTSYVQLTPDVARPDGLLSRWTYELNLTGQLHAPLVNLLVSARAVDLDGQISPSGVARLLTIDSVTPETTIARPVRNEVLGTPARMHGGSSDNLAVDRVQLTLRSLDDDRYWNGTDWQTERATISLRTSAEGKWHYFPTLPPGRYGVWVRSTDAAGNFDPTPESSFFRVAQ
jgi:hypothetical protein